MKPFVHTLAVLAVAAGVPAETVHFTDGTRIEVTSYEIREHVVILLTADGKLRSVPKTLVRLETLADEEAMIAEAIELVGLRRLTDELASSARAAAGGNSELLEAAMAEGFDAERLYEVADETFREQASGPRIAAALEFLRSPVARHVERAESSGTGSSLESYAQSLELKPPSGDRVELLLRLDRASGTSEAAVEMQAAILKAVLQSVYPSGPDSEHVIARALDEARPKLAQKTRSRIHLSLHFMYRDVSDEALAEYVTFLESDNGEWLSRLVLKSLFAAMEDGATRAAEALTEHLEELSKLRV